MPRWYVDAMDFTEWDTRLSAYAVITDGHGHILLTWFNGAAPLWTLPGGGVEFEESLEAAVAREVFEETGFHVAVGRPLFSSTMTADVGSRSPRPFKAVRIIFEATIVGGELGTTEIGGTTDEARWMPLTGLPDRRAPSGHRRPGLREPPAHDRQLSATGTAAPPRRTPGTAVPTVAWRPATGRSSRPSARRASR